MNRKHTFVISAYKESQFLEECIKSLKCQSEQSEIIMITSTPNDYVDEMSKKYNIPLYINKGDRGIVQDWNFAYKQCNTPYITIAHQDDIYFKNYTKMAVGMLEHSRNPLIFFTDYCLTQYLEFTFDPMRTGKRGKGFLGWMASLYIVPRFLWGIGYMKNQKHRLFWEITQDIEKIMKCFANFGQNRLRKFWLNFILKVKNLIR